MQLPVFFLQMINIGKFERFQVGLQKRPSQVVPQMRPTNASHPSGGEASPFPGFVKKPCRQQPTINITRAPHGPLNFSLIRLLVGTLHSLIMLGFQFASLHASIDLSNLLLQIRCTKLLIMIIPCTILRISTIINLQHHGNE